MLPLVFLAASLLPVPQSSMTCVGGGANVAPAETRPMGGPGGATVVVKVITTDDASKDSHDCDADYQLLFTPAGGAPVEADIDTTDAEYGRSLSLRLAGFTRDGKRVLGIVSEGGKYPLTLLFDYHAGDAVAQLVDLNMQFARIAPPDCVQTLGVIGTTANGAVVVESNSDKACGASRRWLVDPSRAKAQPLPANIVIVGLYSSGI